LLRTYGGIFDFPAFISENLLSRLIKQHEDEIKEQLKRAASFGVIRYVPQDDHPNIILRKNRVKAEELSFNLHAYNKRKDSFVQRSQKMIGYIKATDCKSKYISNYFGDNSTGKCGVCDSCLNATPKEVSPEEFQKFSSIIYQKLQSNPLTTEQLLNEMKGLRKEKAWKIIQYLQAENKIEADVNGLIRLKN